MSARCYKRYELLFQLNVILAVADEAALLQLLTVILFYELVLHKNVLLTVIIKSTQNYQNWLMNVEDIASRRTIVFETRYTA